MEKTHQYPARILAGFSLVLALVLCVSCSQKMVESYSVRGMVVSVDRDELGHSQVTILHEAIPEFKSRTGEIVGMEPMAMTFTADAAVPTGQLQPRTKIEFLFEVHWKAENRLILKQIVPLDSETQLDLNGYSMEMA